MFLVGKKKLIKEGLVQEQSNLHTFLAHTGMLR